ncbi:MAG: tRNA (adenosine(37)-N6)-dimethylallyltransferase MiaA [Firmicutes bacterium]|nr:tRNA (adenosine(37)-N6)-dimethylallyltransferase MiaA [Bacillota bacterium]
MSKQKVLAIVGPTGIGKTSLSVQLAKQFNGEIISCDSMQVYRKMDVGTAKVTPEEMEGIPHYLIDVQDIDEDYNVKIFQEKCRASIDTIVKKGKFPILCGGTGLYLKAALYDYTFDEEEEDSEYTSYLQSLSNEELYEMLKKEDEKALEKIHPNNRQRLIRALQIAHTGQTKSAREESQKHEPLYDVYFLGLDMDRSLLHERINKRVDIMFENGLVKEVEALFSNPETWNYNSFMGIGYKEFKAYFLKEKTIEEVKTQIQTNSRRYAKKQYTWFKNQMDVHWFERTDPTISQQVQDWLGSESK